MANTSFRISISVRQKFLDKMMARLQDFTDVFEQIIRSFIAHNKTKFSEAIGTEESGASFDGGAVMWDPLTEKYRIRKRFIAEAEGWPGELDWLMVLSGATRRSLTDRSDANWRERITPQAAAFGSAAGPAVFHQDTRPVVFLDEQDRGSIRRETLDYLEGKPPYLPYPDDGGSTAAGALISGQVA
jgi:hypothetical protein